MPPAEIADLVKSKQVACCRGGHGESISFDSERLGAHLHVFEKVAMVAGAVGAEVLENRGEWCFGHADR